MTPTDEDLQHLLGLAEKAGGGSWETQASPLTKSLLVIVSPDQETVFHATPNIARFIAAANPQTVTALIQALMESRTAARVMRAAIERVLADEESGHGWGPDVTMAHVLRESLSGETEDTANEEAPK